MSAIAALWVLDQELEYYKTAKRRPPVGSLTHTALMAGAAAQTAVLTFPSYWGMYRTWEKMDNFVYDMHPNNRVSFSLTKSGGVRAIVPRMTRRQLFRFGAAKVGSRFIPVVGWGLLIIDAWSIGKYVGEYLFDS